MKKIISIILAAATLLALSACTQEKPVISETQVLPTIISGSSCEDVSITVTGIDRTAEDTVLHISFTNNDSSAVICGETFSLLTYQNGAWEPLPQKENTGFISIAYALESGKTAAKDYSTSWVYGTLQPGTYRFTTSCYLKDGTVCELWADFTLGTLPDAPITPNISYAESPYKVPPTLTISLGNSFKKYDAVDYGWHYAAGDGTVASVVADAPHPLQCKDPLILVDTTLADCEIDFSDWPDDLIIRCWSDSCFGNPDAESEAVITWKNTQFSLKPAITGGYIYEITATWNDDGGLFHGTAHYYVYIASYPVMPIYS